MAWLGPERRGATGQAGFTLIELLVASAMTMVLLGAVGSLLVGALRAEPKISQGAANIQTARWVLERMTRELRQGFKIYSNTASEVSFETWERHTTCGGSTALPSSSPAKECEVTYSCAASSCTRLEAAPGVNTGTPATIFTGLTNSGSVFSYSPNNTNPTYVGITLTIPNPSGGANLTVSDGASLRGLTLGY